MGHELCNREKDRNRMTRREREGQRKRNIEIHQSQTLPAGWWLIYKIGMIVEKNGKAEITVKTNTQKKKGKLLVQLQSLVEIRISLWFN